MVDSSSLSNVLCENKASYFAGSVQSTAADAEVPSRPFSAGAKVYPFGTFHGGVDSKNYLHFSCVTPLQQKKHLLSYCLQQSSPRAATNK